MAVEASAPRFCTGSGAVDTHFPTDVRDAGTRLAASPLSGRNPHVPGLGSWSGIMQTKHNAETGNKPHLASDDAQTAAAPCSVWDYS